MSWYSYWYFTIYSIYKRFSLDKQFDIFAASMFSFFVASLLTGVLSYAFILIGLPKYLYKNKGILIIVLWLSIAVINYVIFLPKKRQLTQYNNYVATRSVTKDVLAILFSLFSIAIFVFAIIQGRKFYL